MNALHPGDCLGPLTCRRCYLAVFDQRYRDLYKRTLPEINQWLRDHPDFVQKHGVPSTDCDYRGEVVDEPLCPTCQGNVKAKVFSCALYGKCTLFSKMIEGAKYCKECVHRTKLKVPKPSFNQSVTVPQPPKLDLKPQSDKALATLVFGEEAEQLFKMSQPYLEAYAKKHGADMVVLTWPGHPDWPMSAKFGIVSVLDSYDRVVYVDADVLLRPECFNLFDSCSADEFGAVDELALHRHQPDLGGEARYHLFRQAVGLPPRLDITTYFNLGVMVLSKDHKRLLTPPAHPLPIGHCCEQDWINARIHDEGIKVKLLPREANWQNWSDYGFKLAPKDAVLHWSGAIDSRIDRVREMSDIAARHPVDHHRWFEIDQRHLQWIEGVLKSGKFKHVLEIGCYHGVSTKVLLAALKAGWIEHLSLCDVEFYKPLRDLLEEYHLEERVTLYLMPSVMVLEQVKEGKMPPFDLILLDGDHSIETVTEETQLILANPPAALFAHDTNATKVGYSDCEGPTHLKTVAQAQGRLNVEDALFRPGERTDRGMLAVSKDSGTHEIVLAAWRDTCPSPQEEASRKQLAEAHLRSFMQAQPSSIKPLTWAYGVTTVPERRTSGLLLRSLASLGAAGFSEPRLFVDGLDPKDLPDYRAYTTLSGALPPLEVTARYPKVRTVGNWFLSALELLIRYPQAERYAIFQDDIQVSRHLRQYLEAIPYPSRGYLNLFTFRNNSQVTYGKPPGFYRGASLGSNTYPQDWQKGLGALALVFSREALTTLLQSKHIYGKITDVGVDTQGSPGGVPRQYKDGTSRLCGQVRVDGAIVSAMNLAGWHEYVHAPSLVQHLGLDSAMGNPNQPQADSFRGEGFDCLSLLPPGK